MPFRLHHTYSALSVAVFLDPSSPWQGHSPHQGRRDVHPWQGHSPDHRPHFSRVAIHRKRTWPSCSGWIARKHEPADEPSTRTPDRHSTQRTSRPRETHLTSHLVLFPLASSPYCVFSFSSSCSLSLYPNIFFFIRMRACAQPRMHMFIHTHLIGVGALEEAVRRHESNNKRKS